MNLQYRPLNKLQNKNQHFNHLALNAILCVDLRKNYFQLTSFKCTLYLKYTFALLIYYFCKYYKLKIK